MQYKASTEGPTDGKCSTKPPRRGWLIEIAVKASTEGPTDRECSTKPPRGGGSTDESAVQSLHGAD